MSYLHHPNQGLGRRSRTSELGSPPKPRWLAALLAISLWSCVLPGSTPLASGPDRLDFLDSQLFDKKLHDSLNSGHETVTVLFTGDDISVNQLPDRLDKWLAVIAKRGQERVQIRPDPDYPAPKGVGLAFSGLKFAYNTYKRLLDQATFWPARNFDANVYFVAGKGRLTRVVFTRRG